MPARRRHLLIRVLALFAFALLALYFFLSPAEVRRARYLAELHRQQDSGEANEETPMVDMAEIANTDPEDDARLFYAAGSYNPDVESAEGGTADVGKERVPYDPEEVNLSEAQRVVHDHAEGGGQAQENKVLVVASVKDDDTSWIGANLPDWKHAIYVMDDPMASLTVAKNKGREGVAYLTYLIDNYDNLPDYMVFIHGGRYQWHNEDPLYDGVPMLRKLRLPHVDDVGYANLRCTWVIGCPGELRGLRGAEHSLDRPAEGGIAANWEKLFPDKVAQGVFLPDKIGIQCGSQFALTRKKALTRPKADYERYRDWLWETDLNDYVAGRVLEYSWHIIFGKGPIYCPHAGDCFCMKYGLCDLVCKEDSCEKRYVLPKWASLPKGWPDVGGGENGFPARDWYL